MNAGRFRRASMIFGVTLLLRWAAPSGAAEVVLREVLADPFHYDGEAVTIKGTVTNLKRFTTRKGDRYYTFDLSDGSRTIVVVVNGQPACAVSALVTVHGRVEATHHATHDSGIVHGSRVECRRD